MNSSITAHTRLMGDKYGVKLEHMSENDKQKALLYIKRIDKDGNAEDCNKLFDLFMSYVNKSDFPE